VGNAGRLRPHRSGCDEEAQLTPHGKRAFWSGNQLTHTETPTIYTKTAFRKEPNLKENKEKQPYNC
jgi:hypothetical protein